MQSPEEQSFRCIHDGITFECTAQRAVGREIRDYKVCVYNIAQPATLYSFDLIMVRTPPRYTANSIKINALPLLGGLDTNATTKFIWLPRNWEPEAPQFAFERCMDYVVKHIKEHGAGNAESQ